MPADQGELDQSDAVKINLKPFEAHQLLITIEDCGKGMDAEFVQQKLFKPFYSTKGLTGMGLGLYQTKAHLEACGGELFVDSEAGVGTVFSILLPRAES